MFKGINRKYPQLIITQRKDTEGPKSSNKKTRRNKITVGKPDRQHLVVVVDGSVELSHEVVCEGQGSVGRSFIRFAPQRPAVHLNSLCPSGPIT
jgi:hypothetical protein